MKYLVIVFLAFLLVTTASADVGPSPLFYFSISNAEDYPEYDFYYAGNIWPERLESATPADMIYKLNTHIIVYAVPKDIDFQQFGNINFDRLVEQSVLSQEIDLSSGKTTFRVASFDSNIGVMNLVVEENIPDIPPSPFEFPYIIIGIVIASIAIAGERFLRKRE